MRGYRVGEVPLPALPEVKSSLKISEHRLGRRSDPLSRPVVLTSLGVQIEGVCLPHACPNDPHSMQAGVKKRFGCKTPEADPVLLNELEEFVQKFVREKFDPLPYDTDVSVETWLSMTTYTESRKEELLRKWNAVEVKTDIVRNKKYTACKSFMKDEVYPDYKYPRAINSRSDEFKCLMGPIFKHIEKVVFALPNFIKKIPVAERPKYIMEQLHRLGYSYVATDYTSFEALFVPELMRKCEFHLYNYMTSSLPIHGLFMEACNHVLAGKNVCQFKDFKATVQGVRMSGEMCTSLGNGFSNLMFMWFLAWKQAGCPEPVTSIDVDCVVEGDDGLKAEQFDGPSASDYTRLGLNIKLERFHSVCEASFCGLIFDEDDQVNVTDPIEVLATTGWASAKYAQAKNAKIKTLLRCKALSVAHQYPGCPILGAFAKYILFHTRGCDTRHMIRDWRNTYEREQLMDALRDEKKIRYIEPPSNTRFLVEHKFGVSVEHQLQLERYFLSRCNKNCGLEPIPFSLVSDLVPKVWIDYYDSYHDVANDPMYSDKTWSKPYA